MSAHPEPGASGEPMPRVSVITPAYEAAPFVAQAISSVLAQTYSDWEMIVADDASADETSAVAESVGDGRVKVLRSERKLGPAGARNLALKHAQGELVVFLDADDRLLPDYLETMVGLYDAERHGQAGQAEPRGHGGAVERHRHAGQAGRPDVGIVACDATIVGPDGPRAETYQTLHGFPHGACLTDLLKSNMVFVCALCPRTVVEELGGFSEECFGSEDHDLWLRILQSGRRIVATKEVLAVYNDAGEGLSRDPAGMARTTQATYRRALERGGLTKEQRRIAVGRLRVAKAAQAVAEISAQRRSGRRPPLGRMLAALPTLAAAALSDPRRWSQWLRSARGLMAGRGA